MDAQGNVEYLARLRQRIQNEGPPRVAYAMAREFHEELTEETLTRYSHKRETQTPSPPGGPPALVGGHLRRSVRLYAASRTGPYTAESRVRPMIVYARIQEMGGTIRAHGKALHWVSGGIDFFAKSVTLPKRPYMAPTHRTVIVNGRMRRAAVAEMRSVVTDG
ncbi:MAG TPA: hypothetical protein VMU95_41285 [Trebonia sp.]|nr:hypothetical protein [Trebonia sp.]